MVLHDLVPLEATQLPSWMALAVAAVMLVALALLWFSMRRHLRKADYPDETDPDAGPGPVHRAGPGPGPRTP